VASRFRRRSGWWFALAALAICVLRGGAVRGADDAAPRPPEGSRIVKIGPQAVVLVDEHGNVQMYDDPSQQDRACKSRLQCWGGALGAFGFFGAATYETLTDGVERSGGSLQQFGAAD
jgi:hypothetical protein